MFALLVASLMGVLPAAAIERLQLSIADIRHPALSAQGVRLHLPAGDAPLELRIARLRVADRVWSEVQLVCSRARIALERVDCQGGQLRVTGRRLPLRVDLSFDPAGAALVVDLSFSSGSALRLSYDGERRFEARFMRFRFEDVGTLLSALSPAAGAELGRHAMKGVLDGQLVWHRAEGAHANETLHLTASVSEAAFASADGLQAAEGLGFVVDVAARATPGSWGWRVHAQWEHGEAYLHPIYLKAGLALHAEGHVDAQHIDVHSATVEIEGVEQLAASLRIGREHLALQELVLSLAGGDLAILGPRWIAPLLVPALADRLRFAGRLEAGFELQDGRVTALDVVLDQAGVSLAAASGGRGLAFGPVSGHLPWSAVAATQAELRVQGGHWEAFSLGAFDLRARLESSRALFEVVRIPVLDGALVLDGLELRREVNSWLGRGGVVVEPLSMQLLTEALGLPRMAGVLSASLPGLRLSPGEIALEGGALVMSVFDGYLQATGLRVSEPFGVASHLRADIEARHLVLAQLTDTFSFGSITGFVDADIRGLELVRWRPAAFDARLVSSPGDYRQRISQRAVQNISALGGAGPVAAIQRGLLGLFDTFGYRELGLHCVLTGGVCLLGGIEGAKRADGGFQVVRGGGIPALDVIGYNRRVDWNELVDRIQRVVNDKVTPELH